MARAAKSDKEKELKGTLDSRHSQKDTSGWTSLDYVSKSARKHLTDDQAAIFTMVSTELINAGHYYKKDVHMLIAYAKWMSEYYKAMDAIDKDGSVIEFKNGAQVYEIINPHWKVANDAFQRASTISDRFGLNLISMLRIPAPAKKAKVSQLMSLLNRKNNKKAE